MAKHSSGTLALTPHEMFGIDLLRILRSRTVEWQCGLW